MKYKTRRSILCYLITVIIVLSSISFYSIDADAASARSVLNKSYKEMKKSGTVFYCSTQSYTYDGEKNTEYKSSISDNNMIHSFGTNESWHIKSRLYTKSNWDSSWIVEKTEYDNSKPSRYYGKKYFEYLLKNLKNPKIKKTTKTSYIIVGDSPLTDYEYKEIRITINKKDKRASEIAVYYEDYTVNQEDGEHTIAGLKQIASHICYGSGKLKAPKLLK